MPVPAEFDPDLSVVDAVRGGDREAFAEWVCAHDRWVRGVIFGVLGDHQMIDDVSQHVWAAAWRRIGGLRDARRWRPWLYRLARNAAIDAGRGLTRRREAPLGPADDRLPASAGDPEAALADAEKQKTVLDAIQGLPALYREPFVLRHLEDWSYRQIADVMGLRVDTVETRLVRARRMLRESLEGKI